MEDYINRMDWPFFFSAVLLSGMAGYGLPMALGERSFEQGGSLSSGLGFAGITMASLLIANNFITIKAEKKDAMKDEIRLTVEEQM